MKATLEGYIDFILARNENARLADSYSRACSAMRSASTELEYQEAARLFESISEYEDSALRARRCREDAEEARKDAIYSNAESKMKLGSIESYERAINLFATIPGWRDADEQARTCEQRIKRLTAVAEAARLEAERREAEERIEAERQRKIREREAARIARRNKKIAIITASIVCVAIAFVIVLNKVIIPNGKYNDAVALMDAGQYEEAIVAFEAMDGYKESTEQITECKYLSAVALMDAGQYEKAIAAFKALDGYKDSVDKANIVRCEYKLEKLKTAEVGDYVFFGAYEQDNDTSNGKEDIEWLVLDKQENQLLVISKYALDCKEYNTKLTDVTWKTCSLRKWLNNEFTNAAFSAEEQTRIPTVTVSADENPCYSTDPGNATEDQVFLLSITEARQYFCSDDARQCKATDYAVAHGACANIGNGNCWWWLRSPGHLQYYAVYVDHFGGVHEYGNCVDIVNGAVRPALWIDLES